MSVVIYDHSLEMAQKLVETENIEFYVLVERMQDINSRLEKDTAKLLAEKENEDKRIEEEEQKVRITRKRKLEDRRKAKGQKEDWLEKKKEAIETTDKQRDDAGKFNQMALVTDTMSSLNCDRCLDQVVEGEV